MAEQDLTGVTEQPPGEFLPDTQIEVIDAAIERGRIRHALFDFDGTISLIRQGWQGVMVPMMVTRDAVIVTFVSSVCFRVPVIGSSLVNVQAQESA